MPVRPRHGSPKRPARPRGRPVITLTTDFGTTDFYVAVMKAVLLRHCPEAHLIDITHQVPRHDILAGSIALERAIQAFPPGTVHLAVVDPGVGSSRRALIAHLGGQTIVCPDNGLITWPHYRAEPAEAFELTWRPTQVPSFTFHGRDIFAPVAGMLAAGAKLSKLAEPLRDPVFLDVAPANSLDDRIRVIHIDHFGNATTNLSEELLQGHPDATVRSGKRRIGPVRQSYSDVAAGEVLALIGSSGLLEIAVREGSAAEKLQLTVGQAVTIVLPSLPGKKGGTA